MLDGKNFNSFLSSLPIGAHFNTAALLSHAEVISAGLVHEFALLAAPVRDVVPAITAAAVALVVHQSDGHGLRQRVFPACSGWIKGRLENYCKMKRSNVADRTHTSNGHIHRRGLVSG